MVNDLTPQMKERLEKWRKNKLKYGLRNYKTIQFIEVIDE